MSESDRPLVPRVSSGNGLSRIQKLGKRIVASTERHKTSEYHGVKVPIRRNVVRARFEGQGTKIFYGMMRAIKEEQPDEEILDIGSSIEVDAEESAALRSMIQLAEPEMRERGMYESYPSSWGIMELRRAIASVFEKKGVPSVNPQHEVMVTGGIMRAFDMAIQTLDVENVVVPSLSPSYVHTISNVRGRNIVPVELDLETGALDLSKLDNALQYNLGGSLMYMTIPSAPAGTLPPDDFMEDKLIPFCLERDIPVFSDTYIFGATYGDRPVRPFLSYRGAMNVGVEAITTAKELGMPGIRIGGLAGNPEIINAIRLYASSAMCMLGIPNQFIGARAFEQMEETSTRVAAKLKKELEEEILPSFARLNWPVKKPMAGLDMLCPVPPAFASINHEQDKTLIAALCLLFDYGVGFCPISECGPSEKGKWMRIVLKQNDHKIARALDRMIEEGFDWNTYTPEPKMLVEISELTRNIDLTRL